MLNRLIHRPVAVTMTIVAIVIVGIVSISRLPVSLMPDVDIPQITVQLAMKGASAREMDEVVIKPLRQQLMQMSALKELRCEAADGGGTIFMQFDYGTDIDFNFIEVNERIDRAMQSLPMDMERPRIIKASATDIPVFFVNVTAMDDAEGRFMELGRFAREVISKRIEQIPEVAMVDVSGILGSQIVIEPDRCKLDPLGIDISALERAVKSNNVSLGNLSIKEDHYRWSLRFDSTLRSREDIEEVYLNVNGRLFQLKDLATIREEPAPAAGIVRSNGRRAVTLAVIKQSDAQMSALKDAIDRQIEFFTRDYPDLHFEVTRNQTELLEYTINNLKSNVLVGALLAVLVIFLLMKNFRSPILVIITIPLSLIMSLLALYLLGISINIISLSGLILGIGMIVDNSIIVIDNITQHWERGEHLETAIVAAAGEVVMPMISSVLTTCSVFIPLIFLSGIAGALFYDQAMGVTVALVSSLIVAVLVIPVYYYALYKNESPAVRKCQQPDMRSRRSAYETALKWPFRHQKLVWGVFILMIAGSVVLFMRLPKSKLPPITHDETVLDIDWNEQITIDESDIRATGLMDGIDGIERYDLMVGRQDFLLSHTGELSATQVRCYIKATSPGKLDGIESELKHRIQSRYPEAGCGFSGTANIFNLIFSENESDIVARIRNVNGEAPDPDRLNEIIRQIGSRLEGIHLEPVLWQEQILLVADQEKMALYDISYSDIYSAMSRATRENPVFSITSGTFAIPVIFSSGSAERGLSSVSIRSGHGVDIPLYSIVSERRTRDLKSIVSGRDGNYYPLNIMADDKDIPLIERTITEIARESGDYSVTFSGAYHSSRALIRELAAVLLISILLLFFILAAQFESLVQPFIILSEIAADIFGALLALRICGAGINLMSLIGIVVMCGIVINDSILKVDTINRLRRDEGMGVIHAILLGGRRRLKPIIMTSLTTILAIAPFLVRGNMGSDLQFPLSVALIGGMILGTLISIFFIPVIYWEIYRGKLKHHPAAQ